MAPVWIVLAPTLVLMAVTARRLHTLRKHDRVLFRFCDLRREAMAYLREHGLDLSHREYMDARQLTTVLGSAIHDYEDHKQTTFNFRRMVSLMRQYERSAGKVRRVRTDNEVIRRLYRDLDRALVAAFVTYTPLFRSELVLRAILLLVMFAGHLGVRKAKAFSEQIRRTHLIMSGATA